MSLERLMIFESFIQTPS